MKPRVMSLVIFTCVVGILIAPAQISFLNSAFSLIAVAIGAGAAGALNQWYEADLDALMKRTCLRPIPTGKITKNQALIFGIICSLLSIILLYFFSNFLSASILFITILFYFFIYTIWLKRRTSQNIVIGGAAGAFPPIIGWTIATNSLSFEPIILFLIIFFWTPSHSWALALFKNDDYKNANIPMLPVVSGIQLTKINILIYGVILFAVSLLPFLFNFVGFIYISASIVLGLYYVYLCYVLFLNKTKDNDSIIAKKIFLYSIIYLFLIFLIILLDKFI
ncbi:MAG: Protoheme IX farnesyltransferase [Alphaproteobacteria bacterium MarineAlpha5_Bin9]|nr:MAG: Protoheme IX farnesyltransferase [Alphaproteobacteria bacterium MarineAlpha5_Bin9]|tara:strand:+ start:2654 stop:3490 length:837 start_codon:yes stop_codon:yes gene_type:complete